jgi:molecular chaperone DnaJ
VTVKIPKGVDDRARIRIRGKGGPGTGGGPSGDLYIEVRVAAHPVFGRRHRDLTIDVPVSYSEATLGAAIEVPTLDGTVKVKVPAGTRSGTTLRVRGKGISADNGAAGDLLVTVAVDVPTDPSPEELRLLEELRSHESQRNPRSHLGV